MDSNNDGIITKREFEVFNQKLGFDMHYFGSCFEKTWECFDKEEKGKILEHEAGQLFEVITSISYFKDKLQQIMQQVQDKIAKKDEQMRLRREASNADIERLEKKYK